VETEDQPTEAAIAKTQSFQERMAALVGAARGHQGPPEALSPTVAPSITVMSNPDRIAIAVSKHETGYCRIFPPTFNSMSDIPEDWKQANWQSPIPWCKVEGQPEHPEFEANLAALERALS